MAAILGVKRPARTSGWAGIFTAIGGKKTGGAKCPQSFAGWKTVGFSCKSTRFWKNPIQNMKRLGAILF